METMADGRQAASRPLIALVGCVKTKLGYAAPARDLYTSDLFRGRRAAVERRAARWFILSTQYRLLEPEQRIEPYESGLADLPIRERREWANAVIDALRTRLGELGRYDFEIHAGANYFGYGLADGLGRMSRFRPRGSHRVSSSIIMPLRDLSIEPIMRCVLPDPGPRASTRR